MASTYGYASPVVPGEPPRTSTEEDAPLGKWKTVHPVGPSSYSATPISMPGKSNSSAGPSNAVRGVSSSVSFVGRDTAVTLQSARGAEDPRPLVSPWWARGCVRRDRDGAKEPPEAPTRRSGGPRRFRGGALLRGSDRARAFRYRSSWYAALLTVKKLTSASPM